MSVGDASYRFLSGAEMEPGSILATYPESRFVARARLQAATGEVWGILIRLASPDSAGTGELHDVTTDDGRTITASVAGEGRPTGDPAAVLAAAKYWELPPAYVQRLGREG